MNTPTPYDDLLHLSRPVSEKHPPMPRAERAAQFSSFSVLTGYEDLLKQTEATLQPREATISQELE